MRGPRIIAFEGPAGAGKSYMLNKWKNDNPDGLVQERPVLPRNQGPLIGSWSSSVLDYSTILRATLFKTTVAVDRFMLSRWVYASIESAANFSLWYKQMSRSWRQLKNMATEEARQRASENEIWIQPTAEVHVLLPPINEIIHRRKETGKEYPFAVEVEWGLYNIIADLLCEQPILGIDVTIHQG